MTPKLCSASPVSWSCSCRRWLRTSRCSGRRNFVPTPTACIPEWFWVLLSTSWLPFFTFNAKQKVYNCCIPRADSWVYEMIILILATAFHFFLKKKEQWIKKAKSARLCVVPKPNAEHFLFFNEDKSTFDMNVPENRNCFNVWGFINGNISTYLCF